MLQLDSVHKLLKINNMTEDLMNFDLPVERSSIIKVIGIGGGGCRGRGDRLAYSACRRARIDCRPDRAVVRTLKMEAGDAGRRVQKAAIVRRRQRERRNDMRDRCHRRGHGQRGA